MVAFWHKLGMVESFSLIVLMTVAMPLKYLADQPLPVRYVGMLHGILFLAYLALTLVLALRRRWGFFYWIEASAASLVPFGYLILDPPDFKLAKR